MDVKQQAAKEAMLALKKHAQKMMLHSMMEPGEDKTDKVASVGSHMAEDDEKTDAGPPSDEEMFDGYKAPKAKMLGKSLGFSGFHSKPEEGVDEIGVEHHSPAHEEIGLGRFEQGTLGGGAGSGSHEKFGGVESSSQSTSVKRGRGRPRKHF
jgi:hypothetical protein